jgi:hypothetical protein
MKTVVITAVAGLAAGLLLSACNSQPPRQVPVSEKVANRGYSMGEQVKRINDFQINSWNYIDRRNAIIYVGASRYYLITTRRPCDGLTETDNLAYSTTVGNLTDKDKLLVRRDSGRVESCFIETIYELKKVPG